jgi:small subunit ribosomal protein S9
MKKVGIWTTGRRKSAIARVVLVAGEGKITVNEAPYEEFFGRKTSQMKIRQPLELTATLEKFDITVTVNGGGSAAQAEAVRLGIARALEKSDKTLRADLKKAGLLTRDPREVERKKYGLRKARRRSQYSKR